MSKLVPILVALILSMVPGTAFCQKVEVVKPSKASPSKGNFNIQMKTIGGMQFWTDYMYRAGWKVQKNALTGHYRLLDPKNVRHVWGSFNACKQHLLSLIKNHQVVEESREIVIYLHGLGRSNGSLNQIGDYILKYTGLEPVYFEYASTRKTIDTHAIALKSFIDNLSPQIDTINFVAHSMGNIVVRRYLFNRSGKNKIFGRMVMIAPPNHGSAFANKLKDNPLFTSVNGRAGSQLGKGWAKLSKKLSVPSFEFGIIAGGAAAKASVKLDNSWIAGQDDLVVSVEETKLSGARDFRVVPVIHTTIMNDKKTLEFAVSFLKTGFFESEKKAEPIK